MQSGETAETPAEAPAAAAAPATPSAQPPPAPSNGNGNGIAAATADSMPDNNGSSRAVHTSATPAQDAMRRKLQDALQPHRQAAAFQNL